MSNLIFAIFYVFLIGFLPLFYTFFKSIKHADLKNKLFYKLFLKDVFRTLPICFLVLAPVFLFPSNMKTYLLVIHFIFIPFLLLELGHIYFFKTRIGLNTFFTLFVTNIKETKEFLTQNIPSFLFGVAGLFLLVPLMFILKIKPVEFSLSMQITGFFTCFILGIPFIRNLFKKEFKFKDGYVLNPYSNLIFHFFLYKQTYRNLKETLAKNKGVPFQNIVSDADENTPETYIVIIGESANRGHLSLYGYSRKTTPFSDQRKDDLFVFNNVVSPFAQTMLVMERVLTFAEEGQVEFLTQKGTIVNYFKQAGFKTYWLSNQYALADTFVTAVSSHADWEKAYNFSGMKRFEKTGFDGDMLPDVEKILNDKSVLKKVIFVHLIGSHSAYTNRYPSCWAYFKDNFPGKNLTKKGYQFLNAYDDSIRYTDFVVNEIISMAQKESGLAYCLYFSDHGEDIYDSTEKKILGHSAIANEPMTTIPFFIWLSDKYRQLRTQTVHNLCQNKKRAYNTDHVIHTIIRLAGLYNEDIEKSKSLAD